MQCDAPLQLGSVWQRCQQLHSKCDPGQPQPGEAVLAFCIYIISTSSSIIFQCAEIGCGHGMQDTLPQWDISWSFGSNANESIAVTDLKGGLLLTEQPGTTTVTINNIPNAAPIPPDGGSQTIGMVGHIESQLSMPAAPGTVASSGPVVDNVTLDGQQCSVTQACLAMFIKTFRCAPSSLLLRLITMQHSRGFKCVWICPSCKPLRCEIMVQGVSSGCSSFWMATVSPQGSQCELAFCCPGPASTLVMHI